jgi:hypothetical protein
MHASWKFNTLMKDPELLQEVKGPTSSIDLTSQQAGATHVLTFDKKATKLATHQLLK